MSNKEREKLKERYHVALNQFLDKISDDPNVMAVIVCGSLAYDTVWEKSDIDTTVIVRDQVLKTNSYCITEDDITINVNLVLRSNFKRSFERVIGGSFMQSLYSKGRMVYTTDESLREYFEEMKGMGNDDVALTVFYTTCEILQVWIKSMKWLKVKNDLLYAQYYLLKSAELLSKMEVCLNGESPTRESIQRALSIRPEIINPLYQDAMSHQLNKEEIEERLLMIDAYLEEHIDVIAQPVIEFMKDEEIKTLTVLTKHFHTDGHFIIEVFDFLCEKGVIEKVSQTIRITPKSKMAVEEIGYLYIP